MIFQQTWEQVIEGTKTMTSRPDKPGDISLQELIEDGSFGIYEVRRHKRLLWRVGNTYAVTPGRGRHTIWYRDHGQTKLVWDMTGKEPVDKAARHYLDYKPARIKILKISRYDIRHAGSATIAAEGFDSELDFMLAWVKMHDPNIRPNYDLCWNFWDGKNWQSGSAAKLVAHILMRPSMRYQAWKLEFELA